MQGVGHPCLRSDAIRTWLIPTGSLSSSKASQDRKLTSTPREIAKSPHSSVPEHHPHPISPYEHLLRGVSGVDLYRGHIPLAFDPTSTLLATGRTLAGLGVASQVGIFGPTAPPPQVHPHRRL